MSFAQRLRELRKKKRLSQSELAKKVGMHYTQIGRYEREMAFPNFDTLIKLSEVLGTTVNYLTEGTSIENAVELQDRELLNQFQQIESLSEEDKRVVKIFLEAFLTKKQIQKLVQ